MICFISELESQIEQLRETQKKYLNILQLTKALTSHFYHVVQTQVTITYIVYFVLFLMPKFSACIRRGIF